MSALWWAVPAVLALIVLAFRDPRNADQILAQAGAVWVAMFLIAMPILLARG